MKTILHRPNLLAAVIGASLAATSANSQVSTQASRPEYIDPRVYSAAEAVRGAAEEERSGLAGQFAFVVKGGGRIGERVFLNSEVDYRDATTLTVALGAPAVEVLEGQLGGPLEHRLIGRTIVVNGVAHRARINILNNGSPTGQFYFQTHVTVTQASQLFVVPGPAVPFSVNR